MITNDRDRVVADTIRAGKCPFGKLQEKQNMGHCPLGFPGCGCMDELMLNPLLQDAWDLFSEEETP